MPIRALYICYFGLREPLVQTQVLPYLRQLALAGIEMHLLTFEPRMGADWNDDDRRAEEEKLKSEGIHWYSRAYHKRPSLPATLYDVVVGARFAARVARRHNVNVVHARSHVPAVMGALIKRSTGARLIFDIRGFMPEEYVDAGVWPANGYLFRLAKRVERWLFKRADAFVVLTEAAREILFTNSSDTDGQGRPIEVIPCCVDTQRFQSADSVASEDVRRQLNLDGRRVIVYVGALGGWYLTDEMAQFLASAHTQDPKTFSLILTQSSPELMSSRLQNLGVKDEDFLVRKVEPAAVPGYLRAADVSLSFIKPCYSKRASSPTKIAEALASGLPIISNAGIGDLDAMIEGDGVGTIVREFSDVAYRSALSAIDNMREDKTVAARCRASAINRFDLASVGGNRYVRLYKRLVAGKS